MMTSKLAALLVLATACGTSDEAAADKAPRIPPSANGPRETAILAGGCFWGEEKVMRDIPGLVSIEVGYAGGAKTGVSYEDVSNGDTGHAESVRIVYDPRKISYETLLKVHFATHDPTSLNRQGNDVGTQYRSAIFYATEEQRQIAEAMIADLTDAKAFHRPIVTTLEPLIAFYPAEAHHQNYVACHAHEPYIRSVALPKVAKVRAKFKDLLTTPQPAVSSGSDK